MSVAPRESSDEVGEEERANRRRLHPLFTPQTRNTRRGLRQTCINERKRNEEEEGTQTR